MRQVRQKEPYVQRIGSKEAGQKWSEIASAINTHADFTTMPRDQRSVKERFNKLLSDFNTKMQKEEKASGISPDGLSEVDQILEEIQEVITSNAISPCASSDKGKSESERAKPLAVRNRAMTSWGKETAEDADEDENNKPRRKRSRRSGGDPLEYLKTEREAQMELKKEEMALRREQLNMEEKRLEAEQKRQAHMQEQLLSQQRQLQQQMQAQAQSQALLMAMLTKMNKS